jgi:hypothetical protein
MKNQPLPRTVILQLQAHPAGSFAIRGIPNGKATPPPMSSAATPPSPPPQPSASPGAPPRVVRPQPGRRGRSAARPCRWTSTAAAARHAPRWTASAPRRSPRGTVFVWRAPGGSGTGRCPRSPRACSRCPAPTRTPLTPCSTVGPDASRVATSRFSSA